MAINLTVALTDAEQAFVNEVAAKVAPGATPAQIKTWAEKQAKAGLRAAVIAERSTFDWNEAVALREAREAALLEGFPDPNGV
jgi:uncharacterized protein YdeI (YjbR/CyaY-like superfamily)